MLPGLGAWKVTVQVAERHVLDEDVPAVLMPGRADFHRQRVGGIFGYRPVLPVKSVRFSPQASTVVMA